MHTNTGGVTQWTIDGTVSRVSETGTDFRKLGRWVWTRYRGRDGAFLRVISAYRPNINRHDVGSTWNQHKTYFHTLPTPITDCPRDVFDTELRELVASWIADGEHVILGIDANEDVTNQREGAFAQKLGRIGMTEVVTDRHGRQPPSTHTRGSKAIDGIFVTEGLRGLKCGYTDFLTDHRVLWIKVPYLRAYGYHIPPIPRGFARRLQFSDPRLIETFNQKYKEICVENKVFERAEALYLRKSEGMTEELAREYEALDQIKLDGCLTAERACRKLKMGETPWSPSFALARKKRSFLVKLVKFLDPATRGKTNKGTLKRLAEAAKMESSLKWDLRRARIAKDKAMEEYKSVKKKGAALRATHLMELATAAASKGNVTVQRAILDIQQKETTRAEWRQISYAMNKGRAAGGVSMVQTVAEDGTIQEITEQEAMERLISESVDQRNRQASDTPSNQGQVFQDVGPLGITAAAQ